MSPLLVDALNGGIFMRRKSKIHICVIVKNKSKLVHKSIYKKNYEKYFRILDFYTNQWYHREKGYWSKTVTMFFASLIVSVLPYFEPFQLKTPGNIPRILFPVLGIILSGLSLIFSLALASRVNSINDKIQNIADKFPKGLKWKDCRKYYPFLSVKIAYLLPITMFLLLIVLDVLLIFYSGNIVIMAECSCLCS